MTFGWCIACLSVVDGFLVVGCGLFFGCFAGLPGVEPVLVFCGSRAWWCWFGLAGGFGSRFSGLWVWLVCLFSILVFRWVGDLGSILLCLRVLCVW